ncbi:MAG: hypothetical protein ABWZ77_06505 [Naasia sp.]
MSSSTSRRRLLAAAILAVALIAGAVSTASTGAWFTASTAAPVTVSGALLRIGEIGRESDQTTVTVSDAFPMTDAQAVADNTAAVQRITIRNTGTIPLGWTLQLVNPQAKAPLTAAQLSGFRYQLVGENGAALTGPQSFAALPAAPRTGYSLTSGEALGAGAQVEVGIRVWLATDSGNEFQGAGATFDVVINALQGNGPAAPALLPPAQLIPQTVSAGGGGGCLLDAASSVKCWGKDATGRFGTGMRSVSNPLIATSPVTIPMPAGTTPVSVTSSTSTTCVIAADRTLWCTGAHDGQSAGGTGALRQVPGLAEVTQVSIGSVVCALTADGRVWCWGSNTYGILDSTTATPVVRPALLGGDLANEEVTRVDVGLQSVCALTRTSRVLCQGSTTMIPTGELGNGRDQSAFWQGFIDTATATGDDRIVDLGDSGGHWNHCAIGQSGSTYCWGKGGGGLDSSGAPIIANTPAKLVPRGHPSATGIALSFWGLCFVDGDRLYCGGQQERGELGIGQGATTSAPVPTRVVGVLGDSRVVRIQTSNITSCATLSDGRVSCWGDSRAGAFGDGGAYSSTAYATSPKSFVQATAKR